MNSGRGGGTRCGFVALIGAPNAGKSTLINRLVGTKVSIVSRKVQTTRSAVRGIALEGKAQIVFVDTPGIFAPKRRLDRAMVAAAWGSTGDADAAALLVDVHKGIDAEVETILGRLPQIAAKKILVLNKIDTVEPPRLLELAARLNHALPFTQTFMISALRGHGAVKFKQELAALMPPGPWLYPEDQISDVPLRSLAAEITREKILDRLHDELPYSSTVETDLWQDMPDGSARIEQTIYVLREGHKKMVIGEGGRTIKAIGTAARKEISEAAGQRVHLFLFVKVREHWADDPNATGKWAWISPRIEVERAQLEHSRRRFYGARQHALSDHKLSMTIASMTGFARAAGSVGPWRLAWELRSVNAKGLDARLHLSPPFDAIEPAARARLAQKLNRGTIHAVLAAQRDAAMPEVRINQDVLRKLIAAIAEIPLPEMIAPATFDGLLGLRGVVEIMDAAEDETAILHVRAAALDLLDTALDSLVAMRQSEGGALATLLFARLERITALTQAADACPARKPEAIQARLAQSLTMLAGNSNFDQNRLHQEALMLAAKADIREELDRLAAHTAAARELLAKGGAAGRRLDFLAQEFSREANTLCAKSNDASLTGLGLELRVEIEQFREQIQNIE